LAVAATQTGWLPGYRVVICGVKLSLVRALESAAFVEVIKVMTFEVIKASIGFHTKQNA
jgi:hypothetical protein